MIDDAGEDDEEELTDEEIAQQIKTLKEKSKKYRWNMRRSIKILQGKLKASFKRDGEKSLEDNGVPDDWKNATVVSIIKKVDVEDVLNYRGLSVLLQHTKIMRQFLTTP